MFLRSIKFRLTIWNVLVILLMVVVFSIIAYFMLSNSLHDHLDQSLQATVATLGSSIEVYPDHVDFEPGTDSMVFVYNASGHLMGNTGPNVGFIDIDILVNQALLGRSSFLTTTTTDGHEVRLYVAPLTADRQRIVIVVGRSTADINDLLGSFIRILIISAGLMVVLAGIGGSFLANRALKPVDRITRTARAMGEKNLSERIEVLNDDELGRLASTLNEMVGRLEEAFNRQRQFTADASHELRTPLSVIQAESTLALSKERTESEYRKSLSLVTQEAAYMSTMIDKLLFLARSEANQEPLNLQDVSLKETITELHSELETLAAEKKLELKLGEMEELTIRADRNKLRQLFVNLLHNAIRYTPDGGTVTSSVIKNGKSVIISISDTGTGIPPKHLPQIFKRFYRVDKARSRADGGTGLGLAIAKHIAEAHNGKIDVESQVGKGSTFSVSLPLSDDNNPGL